MNGCAKGDNLIHAAEPFLTAAFSVNMSVLHAWPYTPTSVNGGQKAEGCCQGNIWGKKGWRLQTHHTHTPLWTTEHMVKRHKVLAILFQSVDQRLHADRMDISLLYCTLLYKFMEPFNMVEDNGFQSGGFGGVLRSPQQNEKLFIFNIISPIK